MSNKKATKRALLTSITALAMCVVMLVGTTFAWFTDTASTNVNRIEAGKLDVALEMQKADGTWENAEGKTLEFKKAGAATSGEKVLWEPGAEYKLPELRVRNDGNLALKYEIAITGAVDATPNNGVNDMELLDVITFSASIGGGPATSGVYGTTIAAGELNKNGDFQTVQLSAKMGENAGNKYQEMAISGIAITVKAMQASYEHDSNGNTYDLDANGNPDNPTWSVSAHVTANVVAGGNTVLKNADGTVELTAPEGSTNATSLTLKVEPKTAAENNFTVNAGQTAQPYDISLVDGSGAGVRATGSNNFIVKLYVGKGLSGNRVKVYHNSDEITGARYDSDSGYVTFTTSNFSPFTVVFDTPVAIVGDTYYNTLAEAVAAAKDGNTITFVKSTTEPMKLVLSEPMTLKGITFRAAPGVEIKGLQLISAKSATRLELEDITFKDITFTDAVKLGQDTALYGPSKCSNITFENCKFDLTDSKDAATSRFAIKRSSAKGTGTDESIYYTNGLTVKNCEFNNVASGIFVLMMRDVTVENCTFTNCTTAAIRFGDVAGKLNVIGNTVNKAGGVLTIDTVGSNYSTTDIKTDVTIKNNKATDMTCGNGDVFMTTYDNARKSGMSTYTITGNSCTYTQSFNDPLNGFRIKRNLSPSAAEFIENE